MILLTLLILLSATLFVLILRTFLIRSGRKNRSLQSSGFDEESRIEEAPRHLSELVQFQTVSGRKEPFTALKAYLKETYPLLHSCALSLPEETDALLFRVEGKDTKKEPALLCAHLDVVPAGEKGWEHPPFSGEIADGFVWGRGSFDDKGSALAILESFERILREKRNLSRTWYIAFGSDEEIRGEKGAALISSRFVQSGIRFAFVLDEGGAVAQGFIPQVKKDIGVIGLSEKASLQATLTVRSHGGHSSTPQQPTSVGILAKAVARIEHHRMKGRITEPVKKMLDTLTLHSSFPFALITGNSWLFRALIIRFFSASPTMNALVRSTATVTMLEGAKAGNIVPTTASALVNIRALPGESGEKIVHSLKRIIADKRVQITLSRESTGSSISPTEGEGWNLITETIETVFPSAVAVPYLMSGASDALHYEKVSEHVYRFSPFIMDKGELSRMHAENERLSIENLHTAISFYSRLIQS